MRCEKIMFHTRFREFAFESLESIFPLKKAGLKEIVLTHVIPMDEVGFVPYGGYLKEEAQRLKGEAESRFSDWQQTISAQGIRSTIRVEVGLVAATIMSIAEQERVQLIVAGKKKRSLSEMVYVGSHILDLLRRSPVPMLMGKYMVESEADGATQIRKNDAMFRRPMLATDWSAPSENALASIPAFSGLIEKALITHVLGDMMGKWGNTEDHKSIEADNRKRLDACCSRLEKGGIAAEPHLGFGNPAQQILSLAREHDASMIVMGRTGKGWFQEYWLGGVSHKVAEASELPVLLVP